MTLALYKGVIAGKGPMPGPRAGVLTRSLVRRALWDPLCRGETEPWRGAQSTCQETQAGLKSQVYVGLDPDLREH